jgi:hypothetical protein
LGEGEVFHIKESSGLMKQKLILKEIRVIRIQINAKFRDISNNDENK